MSIRYNIEGEKIYPVECRVIITEELKTVLNKWRFNFSALADHMGMNPATLHNKVKCNLNTSFTDEEYKDFVKALRLMATELEQALKTYPQIAE